MAERHRTPILAAHETKELVRMVKVSLRVRSGAARFDVAVMAESAEQAVVESATRITRGPVEVAA
jgi:hypothetical protein